jgi:hypothetical protein
MKKIIVILSMVLLVGINSTRANDNNKRVPQTVVASFKIDFSDANNVNWETGKGYYKANFNQGGVAISAFYTDEAEFMGTAVNILSADLPVSLQNELKKKFNGYWITSLSRFYVRDVPGYFVCLENADQQIMLKTDDKQNWQLYKTFNKN